jgi:hypothetical protein
MEKITSSYIRDLAICYHRIDNRGMLFDEKIMANLRYDISNKITVLLQELSSSWNCLVYLGADNTKRKVQDSINIGSSKQLLEKLQRLGYDIPKVRRKNKETYETEWAESVEELVLRKVFAESGSSDIKKLLEISELKTLLGRYVNSRRLRGVFYSCYNTAGTITGRRGCKKHTFGLGGNAQTFPTHYGKDSACYTFGQEFQRGIIARPGKIFFKVDQMSAEDWPVNALAENTHGLDELRNQVDRHTNLAAFIFQIPVTSRTKKEWKDSLERYLGKKSRHAFNYGMRGATMADSLAKEGFSYNAAQCQLLLDKVDEYDPSIEKIFHQYVRNTVFGEQMLRTPFGRERHFHGLRQNDANYKVFNEAFSYIPQSVVADNTGFALYKIETDSSNIVNECHDSITQEIPDTLSEAVLHTYNQTRKAFDRPITFHNGITINIPIEGELSYNGKDTVKIEPFTEDGVKAAYQKLKDTYKPPCYDFLEQRIEACA